MSDASLAEKLETSNSTNFKALYTQSIEPFWQSQVEQGSFQGVGDVKINYAFALHPQAKGSIAISSGRIEAFIKYKELVFELFQQGYSVFIHDHRGQGLSGRMTDNPHQGYVESFDDFVADFKVFYDRVITANSSHTPMLLCHSMGGAIGAVYLLKHPNDFAKVVFCAPMFGFRPVLPGWVGRMLVATHGVYNRLFSKLPLYFWGQKDFDPEPFESNELTHSEERYQCFLNEYEQTPEVKLGGVTGIWLNAALDVISQIQAQADKISIPVLLLQATADTIVDNGGQDKVFAKLSNAEKLPVEGARHEILMEAEKYREPAMDRVKAFFAGE